MVEQQGRQESRQQELGQGEQLALVLQGRKQKECVGRRYRKMYVVETINFIYFFDNSVSAKNKYLSFQALNIPSFMYSLSDGSIVKKHKKCL